MHLIYLDESGNTGNNLQDAQQPIFVLCSLIVPEGRWLPLEKELAGEVRARLPGKTEHPEIKAADLRRGEGAFKDVSVADRIAFRDVWLAVAVRHELKVVYRAIQKHRYRQWLLDAFGPGVSINPHVAAFPLVALVVDEYLRSAPGAPLGMFISDENREIAPDIEKSIKFLRGADGVLKLGQIVEKGFFIDSRHSLPLQLCDLIAYTVRKKEEADAGHRVASFDQGAFPTLDRLVWRGNESFKDVLAWLAAEQNKKRPGT